MTTALGVQDVGQSHAETGLTITVQNAGTSNQSTLATTEIVQLRAQVESLELKKQELLQ